ncbi:hypothetical protein [Microlunatus soli]|nr:hypothetical protein [Microlunatus soli]
MAVGKKADALGLILTQVGEEYQIHSGTPDVEHPEFVSPRLADVEEYLDRLITDR